MQQIDTISQQDPKYLEYMGVYQEINFQEVNFAEKLFVYIDVQSKMTDLPQQFQNLYQKTKEFFTTSSPAGIYHDNPKLVKNEKDSRVSVGIFIEQGELQQVEGFLQNYPEFEKAKLSFKGFKTDFPYRNQESYKLGAEKVIPKFHQMMNNMSLDYEQLSSFIEYYFEDRTEYYFPYGEGQYQCTLITSIDVPEYK